MNFSISEVLLVLLVALLVIKPEQLPDVAFTLGRFTQSMRRMFTKIKDEMNGLIESVDPVSSDKHDNPSHTLPVLEQKPASTIEITEAAPEQKRE